MDVFLGTGLGPRSYAIIEQGMISRLVEAKPEALREFLEEAAGISNYPERRRETENRIRHTRENLDRLTGLRDEIGKAAFARGERDTDAHPAAAISVTGYSASYAGRNAEGNHVLGTVRNLHGSRTLVSLVARAREFTARGRRLGRGQPSPQSYAAFLRQLRPHDASAASMDLS